MAAAKEDRNKLADIRKKHGIFGFIQFGSITQIFFHIGAIAVVNKHSYAIDVNS